jgi:carboxyl-terminal processing protease
MKFNPFSRAVAALLSVAALSSVLWIVVQPNAAEPAKADVEREGFGITEPNVARFVSLFLEQSHFARRKLDDEASAKFFAHYLKALDGAQIHFLESDVADFEKYRTKLDDLTRKGDLTPCKEIFNRFLERVDERVRLATNALQTETFTFDTDERYLANRKDAPRPKDIEAARKLWHQHLRFEYLSEKLNQKVPALPGPPAAAPKNLDSPAKDQPPSDLTNAKDDDKPAGSKTSPSTKEVLTPDQEVVKTLMSRYKRYSRMIHELSDDEVFGIYLSSMTHVMDPHSDYMTRSQLKNFEINMKLSLFGIGALLQADDDYVKIIELHNGPAKKSQKIKPGDKIVAVAQGDNEPVDVVGEKLQKVVEQIRGDKGTEVRLTLIPVDATDSTERKVVSLIRDEIKLEGAEAKARIYEQTDAKGRTNRVGLIDLPSFYADFELSGPTKGEHKSTTTDCSKLITRLKLEGVDGIILDLRNNGGGSLEEAINLTGLFIKKGPVVQIKAANGAIFVDEDTDAGVLWDGPLMVLTSRFSASASEIVAAALQDYGRAVVVGDSTTHGKGTVQQLFPLDRLMSSQRGFEFDANPGALKLTIRKFYRVNGDTTQLKGVTPDIVLPSVNNYAEVGESELEDALQADSIPSADYVPEKRIAPVLPALLAKSEARVATSRDFAYIQEDIARYKKMLADKTVSLNEAERRKEKNEIKQRDEARKAERKANGAVEATVYEVTLQNISQPNLVLWAPKNDGIVRLKDPEEDKTEDAPEESIGHPPADTHLMEARNILSDLAALQHNRSQPLQAEK